MVDVPGWMQDSQRTEFAQREYALQMHPEQLKAFENIGVLIEEVRQCWTDEDYRTAQQHLGKHIEYVDATVGSANVSRARAEKQLRRFRKKNVPPEAGEVVQVQADLNQAEFERDLYLRLGRQYRTIGDALAWQFYGFKALPIYALGMNTSPGIMSSSKEAGSAAEVEAIEKLGTAPLRYCWRMDRERNVRY
jgi:hypothetical protein